MGHSNGKAFWDTRVWLISLRRMEPDYNCLQGKQRPWTMFFVLQQSLWNMPPPLIFVVKTILHSSPSLSSSIPEILATSPHAFNFIAIMNCLFHLVWFFPMNRFYEAYEHSDRPRYNGMLIYFLPSNDGDNETDSKNDNNLVKCWYNHNNIKTIMIWSQHCLFRMLPIITNTLTQHNQR